MMRLFFPVIAVAAMISMPAAAQSTIYRASLDGQSVTNRSGSNATATAVVTVDRAAQTVAVDIRVTGLPVEALWDRLVAANAGPIHLHRYAGSDLSDPNSSALAFPVPFGSSYRATVGGFVVDTGPRAYAEGVAVLGLATSFDDFVAALDAGIVVLNIHTDAHNGGEISGQLVGESQSPPPPASPPPVMDHHSH